MYNGKYVHGSITGHQHIFWIYTYYLFSPENSHFWWNILEKFSKPRYFSGWKIHSMVMILFLDLHNNATSTPQVTKAIKPTTLSIWPQRTCDESPQDSHIMYMRPDILNVHCHTNLSGHHKALTSYFKYRFQCLCHFTKVLSVLLTQCSEHDFIIQNEIPVNEPWRIDFSFCVLLEDLNHISSQNSFKTSAFS